MTQIISFLKNTPIIGHCLNSLETVAKGTVKQFNRLDTRLQISSTVAGLASVAAATARTSLSQIPGVALCFGGGAIMANTAPLIDQGNFYEASVNSVIGGTSVEMGGIVGDLNPQLKSAVGTGGLLLGTGFTGFKNVLSGIREKSFTKLAKGVGFLAGGTAIVASTMKNGLQTTAFVIQAIAIASIGAHFLGFGVNDLRNRRYLSAIKNLVIGAVGLGSGLFCAYSLLTTPPSPELLYDPLAKRDCSAGKCAGENRKVKIATVYDNKGDPRRQVVTDLAISNHRKYAQFWDLEHDVVSEDLVQGECLNPITNEVGDCSEYWNKMKYLKNQCRNPAPPGTEEWIIYLDDDAVFSNFRINPLKAIDDLRGGRDTSFIIATEGPGTRYNAGAVNTGVIILRNDERGCHVMDQIWANRNTVINLEKGVCPTYGLCKEQRFGNTQGATDKVFWRDNPRLIGTDVTRIKSRDETSSTRGHLGINTLFRGGCTTRVLKDGSLSHPHDITPHDLKTNPSGIWREGDWIGQTAGYPFEGQDLSHQPMGQCSPDPSAPVEIIRLKKVQKMIDAADRSLQFDPLQNSRNTSVRADEMMQRTIKVPDFSIRPSISAKPGNRTREITIGVAYDNSGDPDRDQISDLTNRNHEEYAQRWGMKHRIVPHSQVQGQCTNPKLNQATDCAAYWNKIALIRNWLQEPKNPQKDEELLYVVDDDMLVMNMAIDPSQAFDQLRGESDTSVVVAEDVIDWQDAFFDTPAPHMAVNTGALLIRKDDRAREFFDAVWELRHTPVEDPSDECQNIGTCSLQAKTMQEQEAMTMVLRQAPGIIGDLITIVTPRGQESEMRPAMNTFYRHGCFTRTQKGWSSQPFTYEGRDKSENPGGAFRKKDWLTQVAGVPVLGKDLPYSYGNCIDLSDVAEEPVRYNRLVELSNKIVR